MGRDAKFENNATFPLSPPPQQTGNNWGGGRDPSGRVGLTNSLAG